MSILLLYFAAMEIKPLQDNVCVFAPQRYNEKVTLPSGLQLDFDPMYKPTDNRIITAKVIGTPFELNNWQVEGIIPIVQKGDQIYFHYNSLTDQNYTDIPGIYQVMYDQIFCVVRAGEIIPVGDWTLIEKIYPEGTKQTEDLGRVIKSESGFILQSWVPHIEGHGVIRHIGPGRTNQTPLGLSPGDIVHFHHDAEFENEIEGKKYFCVRQEDIILKVK